MPGSRRMSLLKLLLTRNNQRVFHQALAAACNGISNIATPAVVQPLQFPSAPQLLPAYHNDVHSAIRRSFHVGHAAADSASELSSVLEFLIEQEKSRDEDDKVVTQGPPAPFKLNVTLGDTTISLTRDYKGESISVDASLNMQDSSGMNYCDRFEYNFEDEQENKDGDEEEEDDDDDKDDEEEQQDNDGNDKEEEDKNGDDKEGEEEEANDDGYDEEHNAINFIVSVVKDDKVLCIECMSDGYSVDICHVSFGPAPADSGPQNPDRPAGLASETGLKQLYGPPFIELFKPLKEAFREFVAERGINEDLGEYLRHMLYHKEKQEYVHWLEGVKDFVGSK